MDSEARSLYFEYLSYFQTVRGIIQVTPHHAFRADYEKCINEVVLPELKRMEKELNLDFLKKAEWPIT